MLLLLTSVRSPVARATNNVDFRRFFTFGRLFKDRTVAIFISNSYLYFRSLEACCLPSVVIFQAIYQPIIL